VGPGSPAGIVVASVPQPPSGERVSAVDGALPPDGGTYHYVVTAIRPDRDGRVTNRAIARSSSAAVEVAAGPAAGAGLPGPGALSPGGRRGGGVSSFLSPGGGVPTSLALPEGAALPLDDASSSGDPFSLPGGEGSESADPAVLDDGRSAINQRALFIPLAAGLLLCVLAFHLRQFSRTVLDAPAAYHPLLEPESGSGDGDREPPTAVLVGANRPGRPGPQSRE
jgi:hypothetical protein